MNAYELVLPSGCKAGVWVCGECRVVAHGRDHAISCCEPQRCECGALVDFGTACGECRKRNAIVKESATYQVADRVQPDSYEGMVFVVDHAGNEIGKRDGFFDGVQSLVDWWRDDEQRAARRYLRGDEPDYPPEVLHVYGCTRHGMAIDACDIIEGMLEEHHEDASENITGEELLQDLLDAWLKHHQVYTWYQDRGSVLDIDWEGRGNDDSSSGGAR